MQFEDFEIGIDIEEVERFKDKDEAFLKRVFSASEIEYCNSKALPHQHFAARYCAKEAIFKALSAFGETGIEFNKIEIIHKNKVPVVNFLSDLSKKYRAKISLTHDKTKAAAYVIILKSDNLGGN